MSKIDAGAFGQVLCCKDMKDKLERQVAVKISKNAKFDRDNAKVEERYLLKLLEDGDFDKEG